MISAIYDTFLQSKGISTDTRNIKEDSLFFALKGENFNGNLFAAEALQKGACKVVVDEAVDIADTSKIIQVDNVLKTLQELARFHRRKLKTPIIAIAGSNGKTTTKKLCQAFFETTFKTFATRGNLNNHIGVPLSLLQLDDSHEVALIELGANHQQETTELCEISEPDFGYVTNFGKDHLEGFGGVEGVIKANSELYEYLKQVGGKVFVDVKDETQYQQAKGGDLILFNQNDDIIRFVSADPYLHVNIRQENITTNLVGDYNFQNIAAAFSMAHYFGISHELIARALRQFSPEENRSQFIETDKNQIILDAYNANPSSMELAIRNFAQLKDQPKSVILGDMLELGESSFDEHLATIRQLQEHDFDNLFLVGENFAKHQSSTDHFGFFKNFEELKKHVENYPLKKQLILIKGSRGIALERSLDFL